MSKFYEISEDTQEVFESCLEATSLPKTISFKLIGNKKLKNVCELKKVNEMFNYITDKDFLIVVNEEVFDALSDDQRELAFTEVLAAVHYDSEKDKVITTTPDVNTFSGVITKYGSKEYIEYRTLVKEMLNQKEDKNNG